MARTRKVIQPLNLHKYDVLIEDRGVRSEYFKISQFDGYFYGGRNAFLIAGAGVLRPNSKILVEILNKDGDTLYSVPVQSFVEGNSRLIQVEVYSDTPIGAGKIVVLGCTDTYMDGTEIPTNWKEKYNVRWIADVIISPLVENRTPIRFLNSPKIVVEEKFYLAPSSSAFTQSVSVPIDLELSAKYYNVFPNGYLLKVKGPSTGTRLFSEYINGIVTGSIQFDGPSGAETANINLPITRVYNRTFGETEGSLIFTNKNNLFLSGIISSSGTYSTKFVPFEMVNVTSSLQIQYNELQTFLTKDTISFAKIKLVNLNTISGEINKVRMSYKPSTEPGEFVSLGEVTSNVTELLAVDSGSKIVEVGKFRTIDIDSYWYSATMSIQKLQIPEYPSSVPNYYLTSSLISTSNFLNQCCADLLDSINASPAISSSNTEFENNVSYFIGTRESSSIELFSQTEYTLSFEAYAARSSGSVTLNQSDYSLEVYLVQASGSKILTTDPRGQLLGVLTPTPTSKRQNFETVEFNFVPKIKDSGTFNLRFVIYGGFWNIANVSLKPATEPFFSPDEFDILIPNVNYRNKIVTFKAEYLDINNNSIGISTVSLPTYFEGSDIFSGSIVNFSVTSSYSEFAAYALSASYAATASNLTGGATNYIPLWTSATAQSSSNIFQSSGNIGIGTTSPNRTLQIGSITPDVVTSDLNASLVVAGGIIIKGGDWLNFDQVYAVHGRIRYEGAAYVTETALKLDSYYGFDFQTRSGNSKMVILGNSGNIGIGTTSPAHKLDVAGDINVSSGQGFRINNTATAGQYLRGDGTRFISATIQAGDVPTLNQNTTGNATTATTLQTARNINGVSFNGSADITVTAAAGTLSGATLASGVTASSLTSVGTLSTLTISGNSVIQNINGASSALTDYRIANVTQARVGTQNFTAGDLSLLTLTAAPIVFGTSNTERMRLDASGNLGVGTATALLSAASRGNITLNGATDSILTLGVAGAYAGYVYANASRVELDAQGAKFIQFSTNGTDRWRITAAGHLLAGADATYDIGASGATRPRNLFTSGDANIAGVRVGLGAGAIASNTALGASALNANTTGANNTAAGVQALQNNTTGTNNTATGLQALNGNTTGSSNTATGVNALLLNTTGNSNTATGVNALLVNTTGNNNTAAGSSALQSNTIGVNNTATGLQALFSNTTGNSNTATGLSALQSNTIGTQNTATGVNALVLNTIGINNTAAGVGALQSNTIGSVNTAAGVGALSSNTEGSNNTATGGNALRDNTIGTQNTATGLNALLSNTTGSNNTATGLSALQSNTIGINNTAAGANALLSNTTGNSNTATGLSALQSNTIGITNTATGQDALFSNTTGNSNTAAGVGALQSNTIGNNNIAIGNNAGFSLTTGNNNTIIGSVNGTAGLANTIILAAGTTERIRVDSSGNMGIGTTTPSNRLHIQGNVSASSYTSSISNNVGFLGTASFAVSASYAPFGLTDVTISPTLAAPYNITSADAGKRLIMTSAIGGAINFITANTTAMPIGSTVGIMSREGASALNYQVDVTFNSASSAANAQIYALAIQSDGKIVIGGQYTTIGNVTRNRMARLNSDGTLDTGFNPNVTGDLLALAIQSDGKIVIGGVFTAVGGVTRNRIARVNSDGTLDTGFDPNVTVGTIVRTIAIQSDGKIIIGGNFTAVGGVTRNRIARVNSDGTLDTGFDPNVTGDVYALAIQSDGKIVIGGFFSAVGGVTRGRIARLNSDGTLDTGFDPNASSPVESIAIQSDGKIVIGGGFTAVGGVTRNRIARVNSDGTLDTGFNPNVNNNVIVITIQSDGKILIGGNFTAVGGVTRGRIARLNSDGTLDGGVNSVFFDDQVESIAIQSDGKIVIVGRFNFVGGAQVRNRIAQFHNFDTDELFAPYSQFFSPRFTVVTLEKIAAAQFLITVSNVS